MIKEKKEEVHNWALAVVVYLDSVMKISEKDLMEECDTSFDEMLTEFNMTMEQYELALRHRLTRTKILLKRKPKDLRVNQFCLDLSVAWEANTDVQLVLDPYTCAQVGS